MNLLGLPEKHGAQIIECLCKGEAGIENVCTLIIDKDEAACAYVVVPPGAG